MKFLLLLSVLAGIWATTVFARKFPPLKRTFGRLIMTFAVCMAVSVILILTVWKLLLIAGILVALVFVLNRTLFKAK